ncbi:MAG: hypothetical protein ACXABV_18690 [Candidatus Thorarchaeota archaeon]
MSHTREDDSDVKMLRIGRAYGRFFLLEEEEERDLALMRIARAYGDYFNSPSGRGILMTMAEGEFFTLRFEEELLKVTKVEGRAVVEVMKIDGKDCLFEYNPT